MLTVESNIEIEGVEYFAPIPVVDEIERLRSYLARITKLPKAQFYAIELAREALAGKGPISKKADAAISGIKEAARKRFTP